MKTQFVPVVAILALLSAGASLSAHHSWPVNMDKLVTVKGTIQKIEWVNPHPMFTIEVRDSGAEFKRISSPTDTLALVAAASLAVLTVKRLLD